MIASLYAGIFSFMKGVHVMGNEKCENCLYFNDEAANKCKTCIHYEGEDENTDMKGSDTLEILNNFKQK